MHVLLLIASVLLCSMVVAQGGIKSVASRANLSTEQTLLEKHIQDVEVTIASYPDLSTIDFREDGELKWNFAATRVVSGIYNGSFAAVRKISAKNRTLSETLWLASAESAIREVDVLRRATVGRVPFCVQYLAHAKDNKSNVVLISSRAEGVTLDNYYYNNRFLMAERKLLQEKAYENFFRLAIFAWHMEKLGLLHKDLHLRNLVLDPKQMLVTVIDFNKAIAWTPKALKKRTFSAAVEIGSLMNIFARMRSGCYVPKYNKLTKDEQQLFHEFQQPNKKRRGQLERLVRHPFFEKQGLVYENYMKLNAHDSPLIVHTTLQQRLKKLFLC